MGREELPPTPKGEQEIIVLIFTNRNFKCNEFQKEYI
jgi:hypothetical protein